MTTIVPGPPSTRAPLTTKLSYVAGFEPWGWVIGTGVYIDDMQAQLWESVREVIWTALGVIVLIGSITLMIARRTSKALASMGGVVGITTNPTIFAKAIGSGSGYEEQIRDLALRGTAVGETVRLLTAWDDRAACDILRSTASRTAGRDGRVSIEVDPRIAQDPARTAAEARGLWWLVDRPNLFIKIPATLGLPAIASTLAAGISVNVTLIFSVERYRAVLEAFFDGLERRLAAGGSLEGLESVASFFVSRIDVEVDRRLDAMTHEGSPKSAGLRGKAAIANAQLAYEVYQADVASPRWQALAAKGGRMQRLLWASTGVKDKAYDDTRYVIDLAAPDTVNTMLLQPWTPWPTMAAHAATRSPAPTTPRVRSFATCCRWASMSMTSSTCSKSKDSRLLPRAGTN
nr:transaldolase [Bradyrhizobium sp. SSBR45G]